MAFFKPIYKKLSKKWHPQAVSVGKPIEMDVQEFFKQLEVLAAYGYANSEKIRDIVAAIVPTYHSADSDLKLHKKVYEELMSEAAVAAEKN